MSDNDNGSAALAAVDYARRFGEDAGTVYPPRGWYDVLAYDKDEMRAGFLEFEAHEPEPGDNRSPGYRWAWRNCARGCQLGDDGFDDVRRKTIRMRSALEPARYPPIGAASYQRGATAPEARS